MMTSSNTSQSAEHSEPFGSYRTAAESITIPHRAFKDAGERLRQCYEFSCAKQEAEGLPIIGESGTGKTTVLQNLMEAHPPTRTADGMIVPILFATVPSAPTVKSLASVLLEALGAPDADRGTENERTRRLRILMRETSTRMVIIDEFQHFVDRKNHRIIHHVADWLKILIDNTKTTLVVAGLPSCLGVLKQNEQLARRFLAPVELPRFDWANQEQRREFIRILRTYGSTLSEAYSIPEIYSDEFGFRIWQATGGLMGYVAKLLRQLERNALISGASSLALCDFDRAYKQAICALDANIRNLNPFGDAGRMTCDEASVRGAMQLGIPEGEDQLPKRGPRTKARKESLHAALAR